MKCTPDLLLTFVWDKTASGTARSKTSVVLLTVLEAVLSHTKARSRSTVQSINFEQNLCLAPHCPRGSLVPYDNNEQISFNSLPAPCCPRGSLVPYKNEENQFHPVLALLGPGAKMGKDGTTLLPDCASLSLKMFYMLEAPTLGQSHYPGLH